MSRQTVILILPLGFLASAGVCAACQRLCTSGGRSSPTTHVRPRLPLCRFIKDPNYSITYDALIDIVLTGDNEAVRAFVWHTNN